MIPKQKNPWGSPDYGLKLQSFVTARLARPGLVASPSEPHAGPEERPNT